MRLEKNHEGLYQPRLPVRASPISFINLCQCVLLSPIGDLAPRTAVLLPGFYVNIKHNRQIIPVKVDQIAPGARLGDPVYVHYNPPSPTEE